jgi:hypothetical protein
MANNFSTKGVPSWSSKSYVPLNGTDIEIYIHMSNLVYDAGPNGKRGGDTPISKTTPSGSQTPAPTSKVLRWKDLESAAAEAEQLADELEDDTRQSLFGMEEGREDALNGEELWEDERVDVEELFV